MNIIREVRWRRFGHVQKTVIVNIVNILTKHIEDGAARQEEKRKTSKEDHGEHSEGWCDRGGYLGEGEIKANDPRPLKGAAASRRRRGVVSIIFHITACSY